jgi:hypothetical protein
MPGWLAEGELEVGEGGGSLVWLGTNGGEKFSPKLGDRSDTVLSVLSELERSDSTILRER